MTGIIHSLALNGIEGVRTAQAPILPAAPSPEEAAQDFEAAFIAQMLQFSGLAKALTSGGGEAVDSFTQFYLEELASDIANNGGFGIVDEISAYIKIKGESYGELGRL